MSTYDKYPEKCLAGEAFVGYEDIIKKIKTHTQNKEKTVIVLDFYTGVDADEVLCAFMPMAKHMINAEVMYISPNEFDDKIADNLTNDRVFGFMCDKTLSDFADKTVLCSLQKQIEKANGIVVVYGVGASLITKGDLLIYLDLARWEIQGRYKNGMGNWRCDNSDAPFLTKYKRGFFVEWRLADRHKTGLFEDIDYLLDTNVKDIPKMITGDIFRTALCKFSSEPFRLVPYFDPGVWGGQWMKEVCNLPKEADNYAWSFDGVPEENSLYINVSGTKIEIPAIDVVLYRPTELLGQKVYDTFGAEFPIRFDFLDTMGGGNLSLQVHPQKEYIKKNFGMKYTQEESYYILDAHEDACVYLGLRDNVDKDEFANALKTAQQTGKFDADKYINKIPAKKHDHFLIPPGTLHCSGRNSMVLEISATPYIFTFKLWDWGRLGIDGIPRPIHLEHGLNNIAWDRATDFVKRELVNAVTPSPDGISERTGLHKLEFIDTHRHTFSEMVKHNTRGSVNVLNLVEGEAAIVNSINGEFEPFEVHYAETFIIPALVGEYTITPKSGEVKTIKAFVREQQQ